MSISVGNEQSSPGEEVDTQAPPVGDPQVQRLCRKCSAQSLTSELNCPACGTAYMRPPVLTKRRAIVAGIALSAVALLLLGGLGYNSYTQQQEADRAAAAAAAAQKEADEALAAQQAADEARRSLRASSVEGVEKSVTKMARGHASDGLLKGPVLRTSCDPVAGGSISDLTEETTKFSCLAITKELSGGRASGYKYHAVMNWDDGTYTYGFGE